MKRSFYLRHKELCLLGSILIGTTLKKAGLIILGFVFLANTVLAQDAEPVIKAHFIYPNSELDSFLVDNLVRPKACQLCGINADVEVQFVVDTIGNVKNPQVINFKPFVHEYNNNSYEKYKAEYPNLNSFLQPTDSIRNLDSAFINETLRVIKSTNSLWNPALKNGKRVQSELTLTIKFESAYFIKEKK